MHSLSWPFSHPQEFRPTLIGHLSLHNRLSQSQRLLLVQSRPVDYGTPVGTVEVFLHGVWMSFAFGPATLGWICWSLPRPTGRKTTNGLLVPGHTSAMEAPIPPTQAFSLWQIVGYVRRQQLLRPTQYLAV